MATTLFIIGNGFDINCGMRTSYIEAYKEYVIVPPKSDKIAKFKEEINNYIIGTEEGNINWSDFEIGMSKYLVTCKDENEFIECLRDFKVFLAKYLKREEDYFLKRIKNKSIKEKIHEEMEMSISNFYKDINNNITNELRYTERNIKKFISFNYTNVFDELVYPFSQYGDFDYRVHHINGSFDDCALGMDNYEQIEAPFPLSNRMNRDFVKTTFNREYDLRRISVAIERIDAAETICIFGVSLGESDISWRNIIIGWLEASKSRHLFVFRHRYEKTPYSVVAERMEIEEEAKKQIFQEWGIPDNEDLMSRIHIPIGKNIFNIKNVIEKSLEIEKTKGKEIVEGIIAKEELEI